MQEGGAGDRRWEPAATSGRALAQGTPERIARVRAGYTGRYLGPLLAARTAKAS